MALEKSTVSLNLANGLDQKTDSKVGPDNKFNSMFDWIYFKLGKLYKRFGTNKLTDTVVSSFPDALSIGTSNIQSSSFSHEDQLCIQNKGVLYSYNEQNQNFVFKGHHYPVSVESNISVASEKIYNFPSSHFVSGLRILVYTAIDPISPLANTLRYTIIEQATGNVLIDDVQIDSGVFGTNPAAYVQVMSFASRSYILWNKSANINIAEINLTTGVLGATTALITNAASIPTPGLVATAFPFTFTMTNKAGVGERAILVYYNTTNSVVLRVVKNDGTLELFSAATALSIFRGFGIHYNAAADTGYVTYQTTDLINRFFIFNFDASNITLGITDTLSVPPGTNARLTTLSYTMCDDPQNTSQTYVFYDSHYQVQFGSNSANTVVAPTIFKGVLNSSGKVSNAVAFSRGLQIAAKCYSDLNRRTIYLPAKNAGGLQTSLFVLDVLRGKTEDAAFVLAKWRYGTAFYTPVAVIPHTTLIGTKLYFCNTVITDKIGDPSGIPIYGFGETQSDRLGIVESFIDLEPAEAASYSYISKATHATGGFLGYYDSEQFVESNFFLQPEFAESNTVGAAGQRITITVITQGSAGVQEETEITFFNGPLQLAGPTYYWTFNTPSTAYVVYYVIDGVGTAPGAAGTKIAVAISANDSAQMIRDKTRAAILDAGANVQIINSNYNQVRLINNANGAVTDASAANYILAIVGGVLPGTYSYLPVWTWFDINGQLVYSAPGNPVQVVLGAQSGVSVVAYAPPITNRDVASVRVQWYRTKVNGSNFFKVSNLSQDKPWTVAGISVGYLDIKQDSAIDASPELLYTTGGVVPNYQPTSIKTISKFKNRLIVNDGDDPTLLYYSKQAIPGSPIEFAEEFQIRVDNDSDPITAHIQLDDKLIVFKEKKIYYVAGDGANDLGGNSSLSEPQLIASDVGCVSKNSPVVFPLGVMFKSNKGIYLLDRALQVSYIGKEVEDFNTKKVSSGVLLKDDNQIRFNLRDDTKTLVYDYVFNRWTVFSKYQADSATVWRSAYSRIGSDGRVYVEDKTLWKDVGSTVESYTPFFETHWMQIKNVQDFQRIYKLAVLGDLKSPHNLNYKIYYDYDDSRFDSYTFSSSNIFGTQLGDSVYQPIIHLRQQKCDAIKIVVEVEPLGGTEESLQLVDMSFIVGIKRGLMKVRARKML